MTLAITLTVTPLAEAFTALAEHFRVDQKAGTEKSANRARHTSYESTPVGVEQKVGITIFEPGARALTAGRSISIGGQRVKIEPAKPSFSVTAKPAAMLVCANPLSSVLLVPQVCDLVLDIGKHFLTSLFPSLPDGVLDSINASHCEIQSITTGTYFKFANNTQAMRMLFSLEQQAKVMCCNDYSEFAVHSPDGRELGVFPDAHAKHGFNLSLPFGNANFTVRREASKYPLVKQEIVSQELIAENMPCILCVEVEVQVDKFVFDNKGSKMKLPSDYREWTKDALGNDLGKLIWAQTRKVLRLDVPMATTESEIELEKLDWMSKQIVETYQKGQNLLTLDVMPSDAKQILSMREMLVDEAKVDIFVPWAIAKLNLNSLLVPAFSMLRRFAPGTDELLSHCTFTKQNFANLKTDLFDRLKKDGWVIVAPTDRKN